MLTKLAAKQTDAIRRQALALAIQLPENILEARAVLDQTESLLEGFMIAAPREIWNRPAEAVELGSRLTHECALLWTSGALLLLGPLGALAAHAFHCENCSGWVQLGGVVVVAIVFGQLYGVLFSLGGGLMHNLLTVPPIFEFQTPSRYEVVRLIGCVLLSLFLPWISNATHRLRAMAFTGGRVSRVLELP
jgi:hypothetical protein